MDKKKSKAEMFYQDPKYDCDAVVDNEEYELNKNDGSKTDYYQIPTKTGTVDVDDIAEHLKLHGFLFNVLKAVFGCGIEEKTGKSRHNGTSRLRDANKMVHYANRYLNMIKKGEEGRQQ